MIFVGGFLGAGKTTLLGQAAGRLAKQGKRVGLITNDQAKNLVDTGILQIGGFDTGEVAGGCFCCRINDLLDVSSQLIQKHQPDIIIGEPVGSCTDISATVLNPMKKLHSDGYVVSPFSVLTDPERLREALGEDGSGPLPYSVVYIFRKQLEEADAIVLNKADLLAPEALRDLQSLVQQKYPGRPVFAMSAATGQGVDAWLEYVMSQTKAGTRIVPVDYETYAEGEAVLGWLNATVSLRSQASTDWRDYCTQFMGLFQTLTAEQSAEIAHVKLLMSAPGGIVLANMTGSCSAPLVRGQNPPPGQEAQLIVNARVKMSPEGLRSIVEACLKGANIAVAVEIRALESFSPSPPTPVHRYSQVVK
jgi:G3E family GTPase